jgi:hypothetical protein
LIRSTGYLTATASEDWAIVLELCDRVYASQDGAKEAAKALRHEFKYAEKASAQLSAARLWAILLRNTNDFFIKETQSRKFVDTLEEVIQSHSVSPVVQERLVQVLGGAAYQFPGDPKHGFRALWKKVKPPGRPDEGMPFDPQDPMFIPPPMSPSRRPTIPPRGQTAPPAPGHRGDRNDRKRERERLERVIPPDEDMRRLFQECEIARGNAQLLSSALTYARPSDLEGTERGTVIRVSAGSAKTNQIAYCYLTC